MRKASGYKTLSRPNEHALDEIITACMVLGWELYGSPYGTTFGDSSEITSFYTQAMVKYDHL